jgi:prepilin signal peptidase PulO-like enzyme (type II secretory pathway)
MVPELFVWIALALSFAGGWYFGNFSFRDMLIGGLIVGGLFGALVLVSKETWMGSGDIKIGLILGFLLGYPVAILGLFMSFVLGSIVGLIYMKVASKTIKDSLPFAPFIIVSTLISMIVGQGIIIWYLGEYFY